MYEISTINIVKKVNVALFMIHNYIRCIYSLKNFILKTKLNFNPKFNMYEAFHGAKNNKVSMSKLVFPSI